MSISECSRSPAPHIHATSSATTSEYATAARGWKPPGSGITGTPSARAASASLPPVVATIR